MSNDLEDATMVAIYNVNIAGLYSVGKTSIINKLRKNVFAKSYKPTEGKKILKYTLTQPVKELENTTVKISFRDSAGLTTSNNSDLSFFERKAHILCFVYDYDNNDSYQCIKSILETNDCLYSSNRIIMVIRNKIDNKTIISETESECDQQFKEITSINEEIMFIKNFSAKNKSMDKIEKIFVKAIELYRDYYGDMPPPGGSKKRKKSSQCETYSPSQSKSQIKKQNKKKKNKKQRNNSQSNKKGRSNNKSDDNVESNESGCSCIIL